MRKDKRQTDNDRKRAERKQQECNDIDGDDLYHRNQLSSLRVGELELYTNHHKGNKDEKVRVVRAHIGSKILTSMIVQDSQNNIQPASDSNSESANSHSDRVERIVGSNSSSSELNDSGDQAADSQKEHETEETIPESSSPRYGRKRTHVQVLRENYVPWHNNYTCRNVT